MDLRPGPDRSRRSTTARGRTASGRLTWQATPRNKINVWSSVQYHCLHCIEGGDGTGLGFGALVSSPEATATNENHPSMLTQVSWTSPVTNRLLLEANAQLGPYFWWGSRQKNAFDTTLIPVQENGGAIPGINYRAPAVWSGHTGFTNIVQGAALVHYRVALGEVRRPLPPQRRRSTRSTSTTTPSSSTTSRTAFPLGERCTPSTHRTRNSSRACIALYAQDRWTIGRLSLQGGLRFEHLSDYFPEQQMGPNIFLPTAVVFPARTARSIRRT